MAKDKIFYHAFRIQYPCIARELITNIHIGLSSILPHGGSKSFISVKGIWDTGATGTVITKSIVDKLKLSPTGKTKVLGLNSSAIKDTYILDIGLPNKVRIPNCNVIESEINSKEIEVLIGMDIIQLGDLAISNANNRTTFSYCIPAHKNPVDLVEKSIRVNPKR